MKNVHLQYTITSGESVSHGQAYVKAKDHKEAEAKLEKFLGKKVEYEVTQFADANAEIIA